MNGVGVNGVSVKGISVNGRSETDLMEFCTDLQMMVQMALNRTNLYLAAEQN